MTIQAIVACIVAVIVALVVIVSMLVCNEYAGHIKVIAIIAAIVVAGAIIGGICWWSLGTEAGKRAYKDQQSNIAGGIERTVRVFDVNGELIESYSGKFDVETNAEANYVLFDDEAGKRHMIYYTTGTVIIDEP